MIPTQWMVVVNGGAIVGYILNICHSFLGRMKRELELESYVPKQYAAKLSV